MKRVFGVLAFLAVVAPGLATASPVQCGPTVPVGFDSASVSPPTFAQVSVNGVCHDVTEEIQHEGKLAFLPATTIRTDVGTIVVNAVFNADPFITFGATTTNLVAGPVTYAFLFGTPVVPGFYNTASSTGGVSVTNGASGTSQVANSAVFPTYISGYGTLGAVPTNLGVDLGNTPCTAAGTPFTVTNTCGQGTRTSSFAPASYDNLEALLTYTQNDVGSVASWSGAVTLTNAVPEPASTILIVAGAVALAAGVRRRGPRV